MAVLRDVRFLCHAKVDTHLKICAARHGRTCYFAPRGAQVYGVFEPRVKRLAVLKRAAKMGIF